mmetsp:Transcript_17954/g.71864  ORF Transcript_17954/g.71864 Transcript_17954/m.71864 type:complete len:126 (-) Transcript_17954:2712-3089(-)
MGVNVSQMEDKGIAILYRSGWDRCYLHYTDDDGKTWTDLPGVQFEKWYGEQYFKTFHQWPNDRCKPNALAFLLDVSKSVIKGKDGIKFFWSPKSGYPLPSTMEMVTGTTPEIRKTTRSVRPVLMY